MTDQQINQINHLQNLWTGVESTVSNTTANAIDTIVGSIFSDPEMIGYELLQNADDAGATAISYLFYQNYLIVSHNGVEFSDQNVVGLCRYGAHATENASDELEKKDDIKKIGYKGIGFKSVFNIANQVWVISKTGYSFKFDKSHWGERRLPWQIMPIAINETDIPELLRPFVHPDLVCFIFKINENVSRGAFDRGATTLDFKIENLFKHEHIILFLRNLKSMNLLKFEETTGQNVSHRHISKETTASIREIKKFEKDVEKIKSRWLTYSFFVKISDEIRGQLSELTKMQFPEKLRLAKEVEISFAARFGSNNELIAQNATLIFSYLPTRKTYNQLPFFVNSHFLLNATRDTILANNVWNQFLFEQIGYNQFIWFKELAKDERFKFSFPQLIARYADTTQEHYHQAINKGVERAKNEIAFLPIMESDELKKAPETIVDKTGFGEKTSEYKFIKESFETKNLSMADPRLKNIGRIIALGANEFDRNKLQAAIKRKNRFNTPETNIKLIDFFHQKITAVDRSEQNEWNKVLHETPFLLNSQSELREPPTLYFPEEKGELGFELAMDFLHPEIYVQRISADEPLKKWLAELHVSSPKPIEIIRKGIFFLISDEKITHSNALAITRYIFLARKDLVTSDFEALKHLPVFYKRAGIGNDLKKVNGGYLSDKYEPKLALETLLNEDIFISDEYISEGDNPEDWKQFWLKLGARENLDIDLNDGRWDLTIPESRGFMPYFNWLRTQNCLPDFANTSRYYILTWVNPTFISAVPNNYEFAKKYWEQLIEKWPELYSKCNRATFEHSVRQSKIPSYFHFLIKGNAYFPATNGNCYPTIDVFSTNLEKMIGDFWPISHFELDADKEKFLGIRTNLTKSECLELLSHLAKQNTVDRERISAIYKYMVAEIFSKEGSDSLPNLLAENNTFCPKLCYFSLPQFAQKANSPDFIFLDLPNEDAITFCDNWEIEIIKDSDIIFTESEIGESDFKAVLSTRLPAFASVFCQKRGANYQAAKLDLETKLNEINWNSAQKLTLSLEVDGENYFEKSVDAWQKEQTIYHLSPWNEPTTTFALCEIVAKIFDAEDLKSELGLILTMDPSKVSGWLEMNGYLAVEIKIEAVPIKSIEGEEVKPDTGNNEQPLIKRKETEKPEQPSVTSTSITQTGDTTVSKEVQIVSSTDAKAMAKEYLKSQGYDTSDANSDEFGALKNVKKDGVTYSFIISSAKSGLLYLSQTNWKKLGFENFKLLVLTGSNVNDFILIENQQDLMNFDGNDYSVIVKKNTKKPEVLSKMVKEIDDVADFSRFYFKVKKSQSIFEFIKPFDNKSDTISGFTNEDDF
jgi:hypothetical protein